MVAVQVWNLEGRQVAGTLVHCLDVYFTVSVLVPVGFLLYDVELDIGREAAQGFPGHHCLGAKAGFGGLSERLSCNAEE